ncbi:MAG TPA: DUF202 domain-containing protein [Streptosporangiaceae bacterium]
MTPADDIEDIDAGLARERTELAWHRTAISFAALGGAILKSRPAAGLPILIISALIWELGRLPRAPDAGHAHGSRLLLVTVIITGMSVAALIVSFLGYGSGGLR